MVDSIQSYFSPPTQQLLVVSYQTMFHLDPVQFYTYVPTVSASGVHHASVFHVPVEIININMY